MSSRIAMESSISLVCHVHGWGKNGLAVGSTSTLTLGVPIFEDVDSHVDHRAEEKATVGDSRVPVGERLLHHLEGQCRDEDTAAEGDDGRDQSAPGGCDESERDAKEACRTRPPPYRVPRLTRQPHVDAGRRQRLVSEGPAHRVELGALPIVIGGAGAAQRMG